MRRANDALRRADHVKITWIRVPVDLRVPYRSFQAEAHEQRVSTNNCIHVLLLAHLVLKPTLVSLGPVFSTRRASQ
jgi:hypothetical protein